MKRKKPADENYKPIVSVQTKKINNNVEIKISDNGNGIPQNIMIKYFNHSSQQNLLGKEQVWV